MDGLLDVVLRSVAVYLFMVLALRFVGKRDLAQLNAADIVLILLVSNSVQNAMVGDNTTLVGGLCAAAALFLANYVVKTLLYKNGRFRELLFDKPCILIHYGKLDFDMLSKLKITNEELQEAIREHGIEKYKDVKLAVLEADGNISIVAKGVHTVYKRKRPERKFAEGTGL